MIFWVFHTINILKGKNIDIFSTQFKENQINCICSYFIPPFLIYTFFWCNSTGIPRFIACETKKELNVSSFFYISFYLRVSFLWLRTALKCWPMSNKTHIEQLIRQIKSMLIQIPFSIFTFFLWSNSKICCITTICNQQKKTEFSFCLLIYI